MKFSWFGPPKWKHSNPAVRLEAVGQLTDQAVLAELAENDPAREVRLAAVGRLTDASALAQIAASASDANLEALARLSAPSDLARVARTAVSIAVRSRAVAQVEDRQVLQRIATEDTSAAVRAQARARLAVGNPLRELLKIALNRLPVATAAQPDGAKVYGSVDGVCDTLVSDSRFRVHGVMGPVADPLPAGSSAPIELPAAKIDAVVSGATVVELLANPNAEPGAGREQLNLWTYYHIEIRRTGQSDFELRVHERESRTPFRVGGSNPPL